MSSSTIRPKRKRRGKSKSGQGFVTGVAKAAGGTVLGITMLASSIVAGGMVGLAISFRNLPDVRSLKSFIPAETSYIYDIKGKLLTSVHGEAHREVVPLESISPDLKLAVLAIEDSHFYHHSGINPTSIARASYVNWKSKGVVEGASTISMQLMKNLFLSRERTVNRKIAEAVLSIRAEQVFSKEELLGLYLNSIYWGHNNYGAQTASLSYFNKPASELNLAEAAAMAGMIQAPESYSPFNNYQQTKRRQGVVLDRMRDLGWITAEAAEAARQAPLLVGKPTAWQQSKAPFITEAVTQELKERFGPNALVEGGLRVQTTIDYNFQRQAEAIVGRAHQNLLNQGLSNAQMALVAIDPRTHYVKAMVGGTDYNKSQFNRVIQSRRQPGSAFKPFAYYVAFASGKYTPYSVIDDSPVRYRDGTKGVYYSPQNYGRSFAGPITIRQALVSSRNVPAVKVGQEVGIDKVVEVARTLGISSPLEPVISLPLGPSGVTPLEITGAYATFASNGWHSEPTVIVRVSDTQGNVLLDNIPQPRRVLDPWATASLTTVLKGVIDGGTGKAAYIGRPAAGKTGTTSSERDVWFIGYVPQLATAVWIGNDDYQTLGRGWTGGLGAAPVWRQFMRQALANEPVKYFPAASQFPRPEVKK